MKTDFVSNLLFLGKFPSCPIGFEGEGDGGDSGDGEGEGGAGNSNTDDPAELKKQLNALIATNTKFKDEKKKLKEQYDSLSGTAKILEELGGEDGLKVLQEYGRRIQNDEMAKLLAEGKTDEWFDKRTGDLRKTHQNELAQKDELLKTTEERAIKAEKALEKLQIDIDVREACRKSAGFEDSAILDAVTLANIVFSYDAELGVPVMRDEEGGIIYGKDAKNPKSVSEWLVELQEERPHWWGETKGVGGKGGKGRKGAELSLEEQLSQGLLSLDEYREERDKRGFKNY